MTQIAEFLLNKNNHILLRSFERKNFELNSQAVGMNLWVQIGSKIDFKGGPYF